MLFNLSQKNS